MANASEFSTAAYNFLANAEWNTKCAILGLLEDADERTFVRFVRWSVHRSQDIAFDQGAFRLVIRIKNERPDPAELQRFFSLTAEASDAEILAFARQFKQPPAVSADQSALLALPPPANALPVLVGRDWIEGDDETRREPALLPLPPSLDSDPAYSMRQQARRDDEVHPVRAGYVLKRLLDGLCLGHEYTKDAEIVPWFEFNEDGEYFLSDDLAEFSLVLPDRRARIVIMSPEVAGKMGVASGGPDRPAQNWIAARVESGAVIKGVARSDTWARFIIELLLAPKARPLPPAEPEPPRQKRRRPDRFPRPAPPAPRWDLGEGWA